MKEEMKIGLVIDNHKIPNKEQLWKEALLKQPTIEKMYNLIKETSMSGPTEDVTSFFRIYKLKAK